jgi:hypothetical protein
VQRLTPRTAKISERIAREEHELAAMRIGTLTVKFHCDRTFWIALRQVWTDWSASLAIVKTATVVAWHRRAYRAYWRHLCRNRDGSEPTRSRAS